MVFIDESSTVSGDNKIVHTEYCTSAFYDAEPKGQGTLSIGEKFLTWETQDKECSLHMPYRNISLHAISKDTNSFPHACIFCLYEKDLDGDEDVEVAEIRFVPQSTDSLQAMYDAISECQNLNPDPDEDHSDDDEHEWITADDADAFEFPDTEEGAVIFQQGVQMPTQEEFVGMVGTNSNGNDPVLPMDAEEGQFDDAEIGEQ